MARANSADSAATVRTYGNWRRNRGFGVGSWSTRQTMTAFVAVLIPILLFNVDPRIGAVTLAVSTLVMAVTLIPVRGSTLWTLAARRMAFASSRKAGYTEWSGGVLTEHPRKEDLPGPMGPLAPLETDDGRGGRQAMLWDRRSGLLTVVLRVSPVGLDLADQQQADQWVASWGSWLSNLGYQTMLRWVAVTVDTAPTGGSTLRDYVDARRSAEAPAAANQILDELVLATPQVTADVDTRVSLTFDPQRAHERPRDLLAAVAEVSRWIPGIEQGLAGCGISVLGRATVPWLTAQLRAAYDPAARSDTARLDEQQQILDWRDAAPIRASETWEQWRHDSGVSVSWAMQEAPRQAVTERVLLPLLAPGPYPRRVTLLYRPFGADEATEAVEQEITNLGVRQAWARKTKKDVTQREADDATRARQAAREESQGAGVGIFCTYVTTTVTNDDHVPAAIADVELRARQSKLRLRRLRGAQSSGFAAALGLGINPSELEKRRGR